MPWRCALKKTKKDMKRALAVKLLYVSGVLGQITFALLDHATDHLGIPAKVAEKLVTDMLERDSVVDAFARIMRSFTELELKQLIAFHNTKVGKKSVRLGRRITEEAQALSGVLAQTLLIAAKAMQVLTGRARTPRGVTRSRHTLPQHDPSCPKHPSKAN